MGAIVPHLSCCVEMRMDPHEIEGTGSGTLLDVREDRALTLRPKKDIAVHAFAGTVWITQEGDFKDVILGPRETYVARGCGAIVLSALRGRALVQLSDAGAEVPSLKPTP